MGDLEVSGDGKGALPGLRGGDAGSFSSGALEVGLEKKPEEWGPGAQDVMELPWWGAATERSATL